MTDPERRGHEIIEGAVARCGAPVVVVEMTRQLGDILHSTVVVRQVRAAEPDVRVVWAISEQFAETFGTFSAAEHGGPHEIAAVPLLPAYPKDGPVRVAWVKQAAKLPGVRRAFGCGVHPWGWLRGSIVDAILINAGISRLSVQRRPWLPLSDADHAYAAGFVAEHHLEGGFVTLEYISYSLGTKPVQWYADLVRRCHLPVVALAASGEPAVAGAVDGRGTTFRQAKALIARSSCFVGSGSGLGVVAASNDCEQPVVELVGHALSMPGIGYRRPGDRHRNCQDMSPTDVAAAVREISR